MAGTAFDRLRDITFNVVTRVMGYTASWTPSAGGPAQTAQVLFADLTTKHLLNGLYKDQLRFEYRPFDYIMEYKIDVFPGLIDSARTKTPEVIIIDGNSYHVRMVTNKFDGKTFIAVMTPADQ